MDRFLTVSGITRLTVPARWTKIGVHDPRYLVQCDHIPRRSWPLSRAKVILNELIAHLARSSDPPQLAAGVIVE